MASSARIDELRRKFEENPRRYFAPLANEYRKAGDLSAAIALCRQQLAKQPAHMSGYIVLGQALYESTQLDDARAAFEKALALDPENLIALRHLGDIARAQGDTDRARTWYARVLDADPRNDDIAAQLAQLADRGFADPGAAYGGGYGESYGGGYGAGGYGGGYGDAAYAPPAGGYQPYGGATTPPPPPGAMPNAGAVEPLDDFDALLTSALADCTAGVARPAAAGARRPAPGHRAGGGGVLRVGGAGARAVRRRWPL
jgi:tetratricopeptide (TPR) repeat protein